MIKLNIEQDNGVTKQLDDDIIEFLYQLCKGLDDNVDQYLCGRVEILHGYADAVDFLTSKFKDLYIVSTDSPYIRFESPETEARCATKFGNGNGITVADAKLVTSLNYNNRFSGTNIGSFDELRYFTNLHTLMLESFKECKNLTSIDLVNVTALDGHGTFSGCTSLTTIKNYQNITRCGNNVFNYCNLTGDFDFSNITEINLYNNEKIALGFKNNTNLTSVKLPEIQETLCSFYGCRGLKHITGGTNITKIPYEALLDCSSLEELNFPNLEIITSNNACAGCSSLTSIDFPKLTTLGSGAFNGCTNLKTVNIPNVTELGSSAFNNCQNLESINLPKVTSVGSNVFKNCKKITSISLPLITSISANVFDGCSLLETINIDWANITYIDSNAFYNCITFTNNGQILELPNCVTCKSIPPYVEHIKLPAITACTGFSGKGVKYLELNSALTTISGTIANMSALISVTGLSNIEYISTTNLFDGDTNLTSIDFSSKIKTIPNKTFYNCQSLQHVSTNILQPTSIGDIAFYGCTVLLSDKLDLSKCESIGSLAFHGCSNLTSIDLSSCTSFGQYAFNVCSKLTSIGSLNENLTSLPARLFGECTLLNNVTLPTSLTTLGGGVFYECRSLTSIDISNVTNLGIDVFMNCESLQSFGSLNESLTSIPNKLFWGCTNLQGDIVIPEGVTFLGEACFLGCNSLHSIKFQSTTPPSYNTKAYDPFIQMSRNVIIYVPQESINDYLALSIFSNRSSQVVGY